MLNDVSLGKKKALIDGSITIVQNEEVDKSFCCGKFISMIMKTCAVGKNGRKSHRKGKRNLLLQ